MFAICQRHVAFLDEQRAVNNLQPLLTRSDSYDCRNLPCAGVGMHGPRVFVVPRGSERHHTRLGERPLDLMQESLRILHHHRGGARLMPIVAAKLHHNQLDVRNRLPHHHGGLKDLSSDGLIVTNTHIIEDCDKATVTTQDGTEYPASLIGADSISDISVLKIEADGLTPASFADSSQLQVGSDCVAIGNPVSSKLTGTMTNGIISAIDRDITSNGHSMTLIQTNAAINEGNSGGPLLDMSGRVIGITNMKAMSSESTVEGIGFAIPSATVSEVVSQLLANGQVTGRPSIGIIVSPVGEELSDQYEIPQGLYISAVNKGSDAEKKGLKAGDILTAVNNTPITTNEEVTAIKNTMQAGDSIHLTIWRDGTTMEFDVTLAEASSLN